MASGTPLRARRALALSSLAILGLSSACSDAGRPAWVDLTRDAPRVAGQRYSGRALELETGQAVERRVRLEGPRALRFATAVDGRSAADPRPAAGSLTFRVRLDGAVVFEHTTAASEAGAYAWHAVDLPARSHAESTLAFEVTGAAGRGAFFAPTLGPVGVGGYGRRPWEGARPDIVVFLADTFRADNMQAYGGELGLTPYLDELAAESRLFRRAWSVSTYTMPAHSSMFTGLYARQTWATTTKQALTDELTTIAEFLRDRGYRTGAITDSVIVSRKKGLDQGFEWFDERHSTLASTVERAHDFLDADDGRPVFLFVQSYRTHSPYKLSERAYREHGERLGIRLDYAQVMQRLDALFAELDVEAPNDTPRHKLRAIDEALRTGAVPAEGVRPRLLSIVRQLEALYRGSAADLDRGFAAFHGGLRERGVLDAGYFLFTSDHGEAFMEHDRAYHGGKVWEELTRIPLFLDGPGIDAGTEQHAASLIDFAPTIADMAGFESLAPWLGTSLLTLDSERPVFAFENQARKKSTFSVTVGERKIIGLENVSDLRTRRPTDAYDLGRDPLEANDLSGVAGWPDELYAEMVPVVEELLVPVVAPRAAELDAEKLEELRAMGYVED